MANKFSEKDYPLHSIWNFCRSKLCASRPHTRTMVRLYFIVLVSLMGCKEKTSEKDIFRGGNDSVSEGINKTIDTVDLSASSKAVNFAEQIFRSKIYSVGDSVYFNFTRLDPFFGSNGTGSEFEYYLADIQDDIVTQVRLAKDSGIISMELDLCIEPESLLNEELMSKLNFMGEEEYYEDGGTLITKKMYCSDDVIAILGFYKYNNVASVHPRCGYEGSKPPVFINMVNIYDKKSLRKDASVLDSNLTFGEIEKKLDSICY